MFTSPSQLAGIVDVDAADDVQPYIDTAGQLVQRLCLTAGYTDDDLEMIERWLAAHFYVVNRPRTDWSSLANGPAERPEPVKVDLALNNTKYGQQAMLLDTAGGLASWNNRMTKMTGARVGVHWVGGRRPRR